MQGPSSAWICMSSVQSDSSLEDATTRSRSARVDEHDPCRVGGQQRHAVPDEPVQHVDDVVVVDQGVGQADERLGEQLLAVISGPAHVKSFP